MFYIHRMLQIQIHPQRKSKLLKNVIDPFTLLKTY